MQVYKQSCAVFCLWLVCSCSIILQVQLFSCITRGQLRGWCPGSGPQLHMLRHCFSEKLCFPVRAVARSFVLQCPSQTAHCVVSLAQVCFGLDLHSHRWYNLALNLCKQPFVLPVPLPFISVLSQVWDCYIPLRESAFILVTAYISLSSALCMWHNSEVVLPLENRLVALLQLTDKTVTLMIGRGASSTDWQGWLCSS